MTSLTKFGSHAEKKRGLLCLFILHTLNKSPASGYDLLKEIGEKTRGVWTPSKGTLYPILHQLEEDGLITVQETGKRSRVVYALTPRGEETLEQTRTRRRDAHRQLELYKDLIFEIFAGNQAPTARLLFEIQKSLEGLPPGTEDQASEILNVCLSELQRLHQ